MCSIAIDQDRKKCMYFWVSTPPRICTSAHSICCIFICSLHTFSIVMTVLSSRLIKHFSSSPVAHLRPACQQVYNLFHPADPSASRLEPLLEKKFHLLAPFSVPRYQRFPLGDGHSALLGKRGSTSATQALAHVAIMFHHVSPLNIIWSLNFPHTAPGELTSAPTSI